MLKAAASEQLQLCMQGTPDEIAAHKAVDELNRASARRLDEESPVVVEAGKVCRSCTNFDCCSKKIEDYANGQPVALPRPISIAAVIGDTLTVDLGPRDRSFFTIDTESVGVSDAAERTAALMALFEGRRTSTEVMTSDQAFLYQFIISGVIDKGFGRRLRDLIDELRRTPNWKGTKNSRHVITREEKAKEINDAFRFAHNTQGYGRDEDMLRRYQQLSWVLEGKAPVSSITGNAEDDLSGVSLKIRGNQSIVAENRSKLETSGACADVDSWGNRPYRTDKPLSFRLKCLGCTVFALCGSTSVLDSSLEGVRVTLDRKQRKKLVPDAVKVLARKVAALKPEEFEQAQQDLVAVFDAFRSDLTPAGLRSPFTEVEQKPSYSSRIVNLYAEVKDSLQASLALPLSDE